jgi:hypothetical protein
VGEHVATEGIDRRVVDAGQQHALLQIVEHDDAPGASETTERLLMKLRPSSAQTRPLERKTSRRADFRL